MKIHKLLNLTVPKDSFNNNSSNNINLYKIIIKIQNYSNNS